MTAAALEPHPLTAGRTRTSQRAWGWLRVHRSSLLLLTAVLLLATAATAWNLQGWPGRVNDDEGTYVAQAWAMVARGHITHYTYWYDHPMLGWALIAGYAWLTDGFERVPSAVMVGREVMLLTTLVSSALLFQLARRLNFRRATAAAAVLLFALSPTGVFYHRMVFLDNLAVMWTLAAAVFAASRRRGIAAAFGSAVCLVAAVLTKETVAIMLPSVVWLLAQHTDRRTRTWNLSVFATTFITGVLAYPLFALLKNELVPGPGHVSLSWALWWQLFGRPGGGSLLDPNSPTAELARSWLQIDPWLLLAGLACIPVAFFSRRLRPAALALLIQVVMLLRGGYVPFAYVIGLLPFCALLTAGTLDSLWNLLSRMSRPAVRRAGLGTLAAISAVLTAVVAHSWIGSLVAQSTLDGSANSRAATAWVLANVPHRDVVVTDDYIWPDLIQGGYPNTVWLWKVDTDPEVMHDKLPLGSASIDYVVLGGQPDSTLASLPTLKYAIDHSRIVATFGDITIRAVTP